MKIIELVRVRTRAALIPEAGGRLHQLSIHDGRAWVPLLHSPRSPASYLLDPLVGGSYVMAPWAGRIDGGRFLWRGRTHFVPISAEGHALHGRGVYVPWQVEARTSSAIRMSVSFDNGWPWSGRAVQDVELLDDGIRQRVRVEADGAGSFPAGIGWHPWFRRSLRRGDEVRVQVDADRTYELAEMIPTGWTPRVRDALDLRSYPALGDRRIDTAYRHPSGPLRISWGAVELTITSTPNVTHAVVYTPREGVCVEPQTCAPDAFNLAAQGVAGAGMVIVDARHPLSATTTWRWTMAGAKRANR